MSELSPFDWLVIALGAWYVAYMMTSTYGPFDLFIRIRRRISLGGLTQCIVCLVVWAAAVLLVLYATSLRPVVIAFSLAGGALMLASWTGVTRIGD